MRNASQNSLFIELAVKASAIFLSLLLDKKHCLLATLENPLKKSLFGGEFDEHRGKIRNFALAKIKRLRKPFSLEGETLTLIGLMAYWG